MYKAMYHFSKALPSRARRIAQTLFLVLGLVAINAILHALLDHLLLFTIINLIGYQIALKRQHPQSCKPGYWRVIAKFPPLLSATLQFSFFTLLTKRNFVFFFFCLCTSFLCCELIRFSTFSCCSQKLGMMAHVIT